MSGLILCRTTEAKNPYYISNMDLKIYSLEELCHYIYNDIYLIGIDLVDHKLVEFIRYEIKESMLADRLESLMKEKAGLAEIVITILKYVDYYTPSEIEEIREILGTLDTQNVLERLKARADSFLANKCYFSAIKNYQIIINSKKDQTLPGIFYARVYHNIGVAYSNLFLYKQAIPFFDEAYKIGQHEESLKCYMAADIMARSSTYGYGEDEEMNSDKILDECTNQLESDSVDLQYPDRSEEIYVLKREIETLMDNAIYSQEYKAIEEILNMKETGLLNDSYMALDDLLYTWKKQYFKYTT